MKPTHIHRPGNAMTALVCPHCQAEVLFSGEPPSFCGYCREALPRQPGSSLPNDAAPTIAQNVQAAVANMEKTVELVGNYQLGCKLGAGGMGTVYEAAHQHTGQRVAIKLLSQRLSDDPQQMERFRQEGRLASQINHPRCVFVYAADEDRGRPY